mmetsp:Transcript_82859/g.124394  ORF Transcript_82859/g.124394 Transcript_82859/m.124394 type:complete len:198 (+) Transcript_82859:119-712(+)
MRDVPQKFADDKGDVEMSLCNEGVPQMEAVSESEESWTSSTSSLPTTAPGIGGERKKRVSWKSIQTREFALVVGDHPLCHDGLPVSLGWRFYDSCPGDLVKANRVSERKSSYAFPRRLSYEDRRERLVAVSGLTVDEVKNDEIDLVVRTLKESWAHIAEEPATPDPLADIMMWDDGEVPCMDLDVDLGDISDFEWTD